MYSVTLGAYRGVLCGGWFAGACDLDRFYGSENGLCMIGRGSCRWIGVLGVYWPVYLCDVFLCLCGVVSFQPVSFQVLWWGCLSGWMSSVLVMRAGWLFVLLFWGAFMCGTIG